MTMAIDPNVGHIVRFMKQEIPTYTQTIQDLGRDLQLKLQSSGLSLPQLFHKVAIRLDLKSSLSVSLIPRINTYRSL